MTWRCIRHDTKPQAISILVGDFVSSLRVTIDRRLLALANSKVSEWEKSLKANPSEALLLNLSQGTLEREFTLTLKSPHRPLLLSFSVYKISVAMSARVHFLGHFALAPSAIDDR